MSLSEITQRQSLSYSGNPSVLRHMLAQVCGLMETLDGDKKMKAFNTVEITIEPKMVTLEVCTQRFPAFRALQ